MLHPAVLSTQDELVESKNRTRTLELRSFSCPGLMHKFEFEVRNPDQIRHLNLADLPNMPDEGGIVGKLSLTSNWRREWRVHVSV